MTSNYENEDMDLLKVKPLRLAVNDGLTAESENMQHIAQATNDVSDVETNEVLALEGDRTPDQSQRDIPVVSSFRITSAPLLNDDKLKILYSPTTDAAFALTMVSQSKWLNNTSISSNIYPSFVFSPTRQRAATISGDGVHDKWLSLMKV
jgi:hypothetical protein